MVERTRRTPRPEAQGDEGSVTVMSSAFGVERNERKAIRVSKFVSDPAYIRVQAGVTKNMGNYESLRLDVAYTMPCYPEEADKMFERLAEHVANKLEEELDRYNLQPADDDN